eukprot:CCRYP_002497-RA/>CCRYP_002497-RA protein AED:0.02 eAED:0.02 QI:479/1/1/1/1/1/2/37/915
MRADHHRHHHPYTLSKNVLPVLLVTAALLHFGRCDALSLGRRRFDQPPPHPTMHGKSSPLTNDETTDHSAITETNADHASSAHEASLTPSYSRRTRRKRPRDFRLNYKDSEEELLLSDHHHVDDDDDDDVGVPEKSKRKNLKHLLLKKFGGSLYGRPGESNDDGLTEEVVRLQDDNMLDSSESNSYDLSSLIRTDSTPSIAPSTPSISSKISAKGKKRQSVVVTNVHELREAVLDRGLELRDVELRYSPPPSLLSWKKYVMSDADQEEQRLKQEGGLESNAIHDDSPAAVKDLCDHCFKQNALCQDESFQNTTMNNKNSNNNNNNNNGPFSHEVLNLLHARYHSHSTPSTRTDNATLSLAIEGGGMRGAVSGGMAAAIVCLGLSNAFDSIYGSSAGSIIGSYFVSRQLYLDVYTDVIPAEFDLFVSKARIIGDIFRNLFLVMKGGSWRRLNGLLVERFKIPRGGGERNGSVVPLPPTREGGLNISFVLDSLMCPDRGLRPLDLEAFAHNDEVQPLRIVSSAVDVKTGMLKSVVFGSREGHFCDGFATPSSGCMSRINSTSLYPEIPSAEADEQGYRRGLWACLGASMTVPGAAGSPFRMDLPSSNGPGTTSPHLCFDAFCYEPIPFRSAVDEGATHVLALRSRPAGFEPKTKPTLYERAVAPLYFRSHGAESVAQFFERGGQQYIYAEDVLICDEGLDAKGPIAIPPAEVLYGAPDEKSDAVKDRSQWAKAHLLPITVPADVPELGTLSDSREEILAGIRAGFAAAYDALAPVVGLEISPEMDGRKVAELVFPSVYATPESNVQQLLPGEKLNKNSLVSINPPASTRKESIQRWLLSKRAFLGNQHHRLVNGGVSNENHEGLSEIAKITPPPTPIRMLSNDPSIIMSYLPAVQLGSVPLVSERLQTYLDTHNQCE